MSLRGICASNASGIRASGVESPVEDVSIPFPSELDKRLFKDPPPPPLPSPPIFETQKKAMGKMEYRWRGDLSLREKLKF